MKQITFGRPLTETEAAPVQGHHRPVLLERIHQKLKRSAGIEKSMQHAKRRLADRRRWPPARDVHVETADAQSLMPRRTERLINVNIQLAVQAITADQGADEPPNDPANDASDDAAALPALTCFKKFLRRTNVTHVPLPFAFRAQPSYT